jgi:hypothetical protein
MTLAPNFVTRRIDVDDLQVTHFGIPDVYLHPFPTHTYCQLSEITT